jgi:Coenzyme PQQ synthesis protein D (PqqD)
LADVTPDTQLVLDEHIAFREIAEGAIVVNLLSGACFKLNRVGADLLSHIAMGETIHLAATSVRSHYDVPADALEADALDLCRDLLVNGLVSMRDHEDHR